MVGGGSYTARDQRQTKPGENIIRKVRRSTLDFAAGGVKTFRNLGFRGLVRRLHVENNGACVVTAGKFTISENPVRDFRSLKDNQLHLEQEGLVYTPDFFVIPFDEDQNIQEGLVANRVNESTLELTVAARARSCCWKEYYEAAS